MSDRPPGVPDLETRMHDVLAVMDTVDSRHAHPGTRPTEINYAHEHDQLVDPG